MSYRVHIVPPVKIFLLKLPFVLVLTFGATVCSIGKVYSDHSSRFLSMCFSSNFDLLVETKKVRFLCNCPQKNTINTGQRFIRTSHGYSVMLFGMKVDIPSTAHNFVT